VFYFENSCVTIRKIVSNLRRKIMEFKMNDDNSTNSFIAEEPTYPNPNDALFGGMSSDTPYRIESSSYQSVKNNNDNVRNIIITIALLIIGVGTFFFLYNRTHKYDGTYELVGAESGGIEISLELLELYIGNPVECSIEVKGKKAYIDFDYGSKQDKGYVKFKVEGDKVTLTGDGESMSGTFYEDEEYFTISENGASLIFEKVD